MMRLVYEGKMLASLERAVPRRDRRAGLPGRNGIDWAMLLRPARSVLTLTERVAVEIARPVNDFIVLITTTMSLERVGKWWPRVIAIIQAEAGLFRWRGLKRSVQLETRI